MYDRSAQNTIRGGGVNSVAISTNSLDKQSTLEENRKKEALLREHQAEVDMLKVKIRDMEYELKQQKDQYLRKSSTKVVPQTDPELERMRSFIRQLEEEITDLRR